MKFLKQAGGIAIALAVLTGAGASTDAPVRAGYVWDSVAIGGGGFVTAVLPSRSEPGVTYARTDVGGAYRWDAKDKRWVALMDWVAEDQTGFLGIDALAIDPRDAGRIYLLAGISYLNGGRTAILRSHDYGKSLTTVDVSSLFKTHGNGMGRQNGERLAVDPGNGDLLYLGSRRDGLFFSSDAGQTWSRLAGLPVTATPNDVGINVVVPDAASVANGRARRLFVAVSRFGGVGPNLYRSDDGGLNFAPVKGAPRDLMPQRAVLDGAGNLFITYADGAGPHPDRSGAEPMRRGQVWRYNIAGGAWTNVTPEGVSHPFAGISIDPRNPRRIVVSTINTFLPQGDAKGDRVYLSEDAGASWRDVIARGFTRDAAGVPWLKGHGIHWTGSVEFDPQDPRAAWITSGNGVFRTPDIGATPANWVFTVRGMEETVPLGFLSLPGGPLVSAIGDIDGYLHDDPSRHGRIHEPQIGTTTGLDAAGAKPAVMVRVGKHMMLTRDGGAHWRQTPALMGIKGQAALSADGGVILHNPERSPVTYRSVDAGASWVPVKGLGKPNTRPVADPVRANVFYVYDDGALLASSDGGASFVPRASLPAGGSRLIRPAPGRAGDLWVALKGGGLVRSLDGGASFKALDGIDYCGAVGFGKAAPGANYPAIYIWGAREGVRGIYRSLDGGAGWERINDERHQYGGPGDGHFIVGDMNRFGYVYMSTAGRGIVYGRPGE